MTRALTFGVFDFLAGWNVPQIQPPNVLQALPMHAPAPEPQEQHPLQQQLQQQQLQQPMLPQAYIHTYIRIHMYDSSIYNYMCTYL